MHPSPRLLRDVFAHRAFRLLWLGQALSVIGDRMTPMAIAFAVLDVGGSPGAIGVVMAAGGVPFLMLSLAGGVLSGRVGRRRVMLTCDALRALVQTITAASIISGRAEVWMLAALSACYGICSAAFVPALIGLIPQTVPTGHAQQANALLGLARSSASVLGPALAGVLIATAGPGEVILRQPLIQARRPQNACPRSHRKKLRDTPASS